MKSSYGILAGELDTGVDWRDHAMMLRWLWKEISREVRKGENPLARLEFCYGT